MPNNKMERFTQQARRVLSLAQEEAEKIGHNFIGTQHLLLGIMLEGHGIGARVLRDLGLEQKPVKELVEELTGTTARTSATNAELSPGTKRVLELAVVEARDMKHHYIGTEHLLLGLVRQPDGVAMDVLKRLGISPEEVRRQTQHMLRGNLAQTSSVAQIAPAEPKQPMTRLPSDAYELLENVLMKILEMIESGKLPVAQGIELFSTLTPDLKLAPGQQTELISHLFEQKRFSDYKVCVKATDSKGVETFNQADIPLPTLLAEIDQFLGAVINAHVLPLVFTLGDSSLEVRIEKNKNQT